MERAIVRKRENNQTSVTRIRRSVNTSQNWEWKTKGRNVMNTCEGSLCRCGKGIFRYTWTEREEYLDTKIMSNCNS